MSTALELARTHLAELREELAAAARRRPRSIIRRTRPTCSEEMPIAEAAYVAPP